jgi:hypothetical protein
MPRMAGALNTVYTVVAIAVAILGLLFVVFRTGERDVELLVSMVVGIVLLLGVGATMLM